MNGDNNINQSLTSTRIEVFDKILQSEIDNNTFQNLKHAEIFQSDSKNDQMQQWMHKNLNKHDVSIQNDGENDQFERQNSNFLKSSQHLKFIIKEIEFSKNKLKNGALESKNVKFNNPLRNKMASTSSNLNNIEQTKSNVSTRNETKDNISTDVVKRGPGRPKSDSKLSNINKNSKNDENIKKESNINDNGIIKEEVNGKDKFPTNNDIKKNFIETDNELINDQYERYKSFPTHSRSSFKTINSELQRMISEKIVCIPIFQNLQPGQIEFLKVHNKKPISKTCTIDENLDKFKLQNIMNSMRDWFNQHGIKFFNKMEVKQVMKLQDEYIELMEELMG